MSDRLRDTALYMKQHAQEFEDPTPEEMETLMDKCPSECLMAQILYDSCEINVFELLGDRVHWYESLFRGDKKIQEITIPGDCKVVPLDTFKWSSLKKVTLEEGITDINRRAFCYTSLTEVKIPKSCKIIDSEAFTNCHNLTNVDLGAVTRIGQSAFSGTGITSITIPGTCKYVDSYAFESCDDLESVTIEDGVKDLGSMVFCQCPMLSVIEIPQTIKYISEAPGGLWNDGHYNTGTIKYKIRGLNKEEGRAWADNHIRFSSQRWHDRFIRKIV